MQRSITVTQAGEVRWPPPPVQVSAAPTSAGPSEPAHRARRRTNSPSGPSAPSSAGTPGSAWRRWRSPRPLPSRRASFLGYFTVFVLAVVVGFYVISNVSASLHTPLMAQTNAISGHHPGRRAAAARQHERAGRRARLRGRDRRVHQHLRRVRGRRPDDLHVPEGRLSDVDTDRLLSLVQAAYLIAGVLFILSLAGLSHQRSAKAGNTAGKIGMVIALAATVGLSLLESDQNPAVTAALIAAALLIGAVIGTRVARRVEMTQMPEMIAILHSFVGLAAVLVGFNSYLTEESSSDTVHLAEVFIGIFIGAVTFTGSRRGLRPHHQHRERIGPARPARPAQLLGGQGRHPLDHPRARARVAEVRRHRQLHRAAGEDAHDRRRWPSRGDFMTGPEWDPENIAPMVVFLASDAAADVSGQVFVVFGPNVYLMEGWQMVSELHRRRRRAAGHARGADRPQGRALRGPAQQGSATWASGSSADAAEGSPARRSAPLHGGEPRATTTRTKISTRARRSRSGSGTSARTRSRAGSPRAASPRATGSRSTCRASTA